MGKNKGKLKTAEGTAKVADTGGSDVLGTVESKEKEEEDEEEEDIDPTLAPYCQGNDNDDEDEDDDDVDADDEGEVDNKGRSLWRVECWRGQRKDGKFKTTKNCECQGKYLGLPCHPIQAYAYVKRKIDGKKVQLCRPCEYAYFENVVEGNIVPDIVEKNTVHTFDEGGANPIDVTIACGASNFLDELWESNKWSVTNFEFLEMPEEQQRQWDGLIEDKIFFEKFGRALSSGLDSETSARIQSKYPIMRSVLQLMGGDDYQNLAKTMLATNWVTAGLKKSTQGFHNDSFLHDGVQHRHAWTFGLWDEGEVKKLMTMADRERGLWGGFLCFHSTCVTMSRKGSGQDAIELQHAVHFGDNVLCLIMETLN